MQLRGEVKRRWGRLTDDDVAILDGKLDQVAGRIVELYGITREQVGVELDHLVGDLNELGAAAPADKALAEKALAEKAVAAVPK